MNDCLFYFVAHGDCLRIEKSFRKILAEKAQMICKFIHQ